MLEDDDDAAIVDAVITLANTLDLKTLAEGVETDRHLQVLQQKGCDYVQGFLFSKPLAADAFTEFLGQSHPG
jgi:EAL domain-containing protein (putative c-di-GMP-specific phosphodiesterase class I)